MVPGVTHVFVQNCMEQCFKIYIRNARTDRYNLMCYIDAHEKQHTSYVDDSISIGDNTIPSNSTREALDSLCATVDFIDCWIKCFGKQYQDRFNMYIRKIPFNFLNHLVVRENANIYYILLEVICT